MKFVQKRLDFDGHEFFTKQDSKPEGLATDRAEAINQESVSVRVDSTRLGLNREKEHIIRGEILCHLKSARASYFDSVLLGNGNNEALERAAPWLEMAEKIL